MQNRTCRGGISAFIFLFVLIKALSAHAQQWTQLPPTPALPKPDRSGIAAVNGIRSGMPFWSGRTRHFYPRRKGKFKLWGFRFLRWHAIIRCRAR